MSAFGKILLTGGYLVLDRQYSGFVVASTAAISTTVLQSDTSLLSPNSFTIRVLSPQFLDGDWIFSCTLAPLQLEVTSTNTNTFIHHALSTTLSYLASFNSPHTALIGSHTISILAHNDFYSQQATLHKLNLPRTRASLTSLPPSMPLDCTIARVNKTGLGSSAALVTSLIKAMLIHHKEIHQLNDINDVLFKLSQIAHSAAQGKVGSGFDVSAAVYGSHLYTRFTPPLINTSESVRATVDKTWDHMIEKRNLPRGLTILLGDICGGSSTTGMVSGVLRWREEYGDALFSTLDLLNAKFVKLLLCLDEQSGETGYDVKLNELSLISHLDWSRVESRLSQTLQMIHTTFEDIRANLRLLGEQARVPIEPLTQTTLLDACIKLPGVLCAGVPGAGGYDAIFVLLLGSDTALLESLFEERGVTMLSCGGV